MTPWQRFKHSILPLIIQEKVRAALAMLSMVLLALSSGLYALLAGPGIKVMFGGNPRDFLFDERGDAKIPLFGLDSEALLAWIENHPTQMLMFLPIALVVTSVIKGIGQSGQFYLWGHVAQSVLFELRRRLLWTVLQRPPRDLEVHRQGDLQSRLMQDLQTVEFAVFYALGSSLREPLVMAILISVCVVTEPLLSLFVFVLLPISVFVVVRFTKGLSKVSHRTQNLQGQLQSMIHEALGGVKELQAFGQLGTFLKKFSRESGRYREDMNKSYFIRAVKTPTMELFSISLLAALIFALGYAVQFRGADPARYITFIVAIVLLYEPLKKLSQVSDHLATAAAALKRLEPLFADENKPKIMQETQPKEPFKMPDTAASLAFHSVCFSYAEETVLEDLSFELKVGQRLALVGPSGGGKSTLFKLALGFEQAFSGSVHVMGHPLSPSNAAALREHIAWVSQDTFLFHASVAENIAFANPNASRQDIENAARNAAAHTFIKALPEGYATILGERGANLSGGQRQRISLARAFLADRPILLLDEATANLDAASEDHVQQALERLMVNRSVIVIAHRLATARSADEILVVDRGQIRERGSHDDLILRSGLYAELHALQSQHEDGAS